MLNTRLVRWGNSVAVRIPKKIAETAGLAEGDELDVKASAGVILIEKKVKTPSIEELCSRITRANKHEIVDWGQPLGKEIW